MIKGLFYIVHVDTPFLSKIFTPFASGLWRTDLTGMRDTFLVGDVYGQFTDIPGIETSDIGSIRVGLDYYDRVETIEECFDTSGTYVYIPDEHALIMNIEYQGKGWQVPWGKRLEIGLITYYSTGVDFSRKDEAYYNDNYHDPRVMSIPDFSSKRDRTFFGVNAYTVFYIELDNHDGKFDTVDMSGNVVRVYAAEAGGNYFESDLCQKGFVTKVSRSNKKVTLSVGDKRKTLDVNINLGKITKVNYLYLDDDTANENKIIPIPIGDIENYKPRCVDKDNHESAAASYILGKATQKYRLEGPKNVWVQKTDGNSELYDLIFPAPGETISSPSPLSADSKYASVSTESYSFDKDSGLLSVPRSAVCSATINDSETTYDWTDLNVNYGGWMNSGNGESKYFCGVDLARIAVETFKGEEFLEFNVDLDSYARERIKSMVIPRKYSILIEDDMTITEYLKKVCEASDMIITCRGDGRYAFRVRYGTPPPPTIEIPVEDLIGRDTAAETTNLSEVVPAIEIEYGKAGYSSNKKKYKDESRRETIEQKFHISPDITTSSVIVADEDSAKDKAKSILDNSENPPVDTSRTMPMTAELAHVDCVDTVIVPSGRGSGRIIGEVTQVKKSVGKNQITWTLIKTSDVKRDAGYIQGTVYGRTVFGRNAFAETTREAQ